MRPRRWTRIALLAVAVAYAAAAVRYRVIGADGQAWRWAINGDGAGYHGMLVGLVLHGNPAKAPINPAFFTPAGDGHVIQYTCGASLMQAPFFLAAHAVALIRGTVDASALGIEYQFGALLAALCWSLLALWLLGRITARAGLLDAVGAFTVLLLGLGTGLIHYAVITPAMSHAYGFAAVSWSLFEAQRALQGRSGAWPRLAAALALAVLVRPTLGLVALMLPVVALNGQERAIPPLRPKPLLWTVAAGAAALSIQPVLWKLQCGAWLVDGYAGEGFNWSRPRLWSVLFGARKGLFFYWPALLLTLPALGWALLRRTGPALPMAVGLALLAYVTSAWWNWYYGHGYGMRPLVDALPVLGLLIAAWLAALSTTWRTAAMAMAAPLILLQLFQAWQYEAGILHPFNMDREKHALILLRTGDEARHRFGDAYVAELYAPKGMDTLASVTLSGDSVVHLSGASPFTPALRLSGDRLPAGRELFADIQLRRRALDPFASDTVLLVFTYATEGRQRMHESFALNDIRRLDDRQWRHWRYAFNMPSTLPREEVYFYLWQPGQGRVEVRDLKVTLRAVRP